MNLVLVIMLIMQARSLKISLETTCTPTRRGMSSDLTVVGGWDCGWKDNYSSEMLMNSFLYTRPGS